MRICHIIETAGGGSGQVALDLVRSAREAGDNVTLVYSPERAEPRFVSEATEMKVHVRLYPLSMQRSVGPHDFVSLMRLWKLLRTTGPYDVIHSHSSKAGALARLARPLLPRRMVHIYTPHAFVSMAPGASPLYGVIERMLSKFCDRIIAVSAAEKRHAVEQLGIPEEEVTVIPNGIALDYPADRAAARQAIGAAEGEFVVGFVGRLVEQKNPKRLVEAFALAAKRHSGLRLAIIGDGPLRVVAEELAQARGVAQRVHFLGDCVGRDIIPGFDCLACASDYEAFPIVFLEALAAGVPIIATPVGGTEETAKGTGIVTNDFTAESLAASMLVLAAESPEKRDQRLAAVRQRAGAFSLARMGERTRALYIEEMEKRAR